MGLRCQVRTIERVCEIPHEGPFCDLMWSDPEDIDTWAVSPRGAGWLFGGKVRLGRLPPVLGYEPSVYAAFAGPLVAGCE